MPLFGIQHVVLNTYQESIVKEWAKHAPKGWGPKKNVEFNLRNFAKYIVRKQSDVKDS